MTELESRSLRFLCFGAGAIGTYIGGNLALAGYPVTFLERPDVAERLRESGLHLRINGEEKVLQTPMIADSLEAALAMGPFDVGILAVKSYDTAGVLDTLRGHLDEIPPVLCLQNGVENEGLLAAVLGEERVIAGTVTSAVGRRAAGDIVLERLRGIGIANIHPLAPGLAAAMNAAGLQARLYPDAGSMKWSKMLTNLIANASSAILDMTPAQIFDDRDLFHLEMRQLREALAVMDALHLQVVDLPGTKVRLLGWAARSLPETLGQPLLRRAVGRGRGNKMPSFHIDLYSGRGKSEVEYLNGAVVRLGREVGVATPVNQLLTETLLGLTDETLSRADFARNPQRLLKALPHF